MSHRIGKNNARNRANRAKIEVTPLYDARTSELKEGSIIKSKSGKSYRVGTHGELIRIGQ